MGVLISAVQWIPSKELLDRSPRAGGLPWGELVFGSWNPELIPTLVVREAYGTRARDTDWMDGFYPYHEMDAYLGLVAMALAVIGAGGASRRDRWANFWVILVGIGAILMLGKFTFLFDHANEIPILGSSREPVRFHLWVSIGVAALAAVGVERLRRPGTVSLRGGLILAVVLVVVSIPIMICFYNPGVEPAQEMDRDLSPRPVSLARSRADRANPEDGDRLRAGLVGRAECRSLDGRVAASPLGRLACRSLVMADLLGAHWRDVPTVEPRYWTEAPESAKRLKADPSLIRIFARGDKHSGEPGYASERVNFLTVRDPLDWSLPPVWHIPTSRGNTPMISRRLQLYSALTEKFPWRHDLESDSHIVTGRKLHPAYRHLPTEPVGSAFIHRNRTALPRARLVGRPVYADDLQQAAVALFRQGSELRDRVVVEDPSRPLSSDASVSGVGTRSSRNSQSKSRSRLSPTHPPISSFPTPSTRAGRRPSTADRRRSFPLTSPFERSIFPRETTPLSSATAPPDSEGPGRHRASGSSWAWSWDSGPGCRRRCCPSTTPWAGPPGGGPPGS